MGPSFPKLTLLEVIRFLAKPLDCDASSVFYKLLTVLDARGRGPAVPRGQHLLETVCRVSCEWRIRPALLLSFALVVCIVFLVTLYNACVSLVRWYAAARGSAFVAIATRALRELHANGALYATESGAWATGATADASSAAAAIPRTAGAHRWYSPQAVTAPVVCCGCFQPVVLSQGSEGQAQSCELCGTVAHVRCIKAVPHYCRLLSLAVPPPPLAPESAARAAAPSPPPLPPLPHDWRPAGTTLDLILPPADAESLLTGGDTIWPNNGWPNGGPPSSAAPVASATGASASHGPSSLCLYCGEPCEVGLLAVEPVWRCGSCRRFTHVQCWASLHPGVLSAATRAALEGQAMDAEEITGSPRGASFQWDDLADSSEDARDGGSGGGGSGVGGRGPLTGTSTARPGDGPTSETSSTPAGTPQPFSRFRGVGTAAGSGTVTTATTTTGRKSGNGGGGGGGGGVTDQPARTHRHSVRTLHPSGLIAAATAAVTCSAALQKTQAAADGRARAAGGGPSGMGTGGAWDGHRRCHSSPNIAGHASGGGNRGGVSGGGGSGAPNHHRGQGCDAAAGSTSAAAQIGVPPTIPPTSTTVRAPGSASGPCEGSDGATRGSTTEAAAVAVVAVRCSNDSGRLARLDRCDPLNSLGTLGALVVPPTAVHPTATRRASFLPGRADKSSAAAAAAVPVTGSTAAPATASGSTTAAAAAAPAAAAATGSGGGGSGGGRKKKLQKQQQQQQMQLGRTLRQQAQQWYRSHAAGWTLATCVDAAAPDRFRHFRIRALPPGYKPLLVFINPRSGPQAGEHLRRQLLQLLHPMQVIDLARETPGAALRCWWGVSGLRVLVVGGDGTAGWILGEMEIVMAEHTTAAAALETNGGGNSSGEQDGGDSGMSTAAGPAVAAMTPPPSPPPPVAVLPLGTGNDLARVLGWGGGLATLEARGGLGPALAEVASAAPTPLDRWALTIATTPPEPVKRRSSFLPRRRQPAATAARTAPPAVVQVKMFNNYLGIGIDSWCALEFHRMRERYPGWFKSQLGNKMWYTGVGARDLLARSCVDLPSRLQLECDGCLMDLPPGTQGVLLLSIPSYMGGVDLWGNGVSQQQHQVMMQAAAAAAADGSGSGRINGGGIAGAAGGSALRRTSLSSNGPTIAASKASVDAAHLPQLPQQQPAMLLPPSLSLGAAAEQQQLTAAAPPPLKLHPDVPQSISDGVLEVVVVYGAVHLGQLQVGLARATRLCQCRTAVITTRQALPMQVDGEPWMQPAARLAVSLKGGATILRRLSSATSRLTAAVGEVLDGAVVRGTITAAQRLMLGVELAQRLGAPHAV